MRNLSLLVDCPTPESEFGQDVQSQFGAVGGEADPGAHPRQSRGTGLTIGIQLSNGQWSTGEENIPVKEDFIKPID